MMKAQEDVQQQQEIQHQLDLEKETKEQQDHYWANNPPAQGWSLAKALEGVPGTTSSRMTQQKSSHHNSSGVLGEVKLSTWMFTSIGDTPSQLMISYHPTTSRLNTQSIITATTTITSNNTPSKKKSIQFLWQPLRLYQCCY
jgi:hypothetical protein